MYNTKFWPYIFAYAEEAKFSLCMLEHNIMIIEEGVEV
jgi:hypothetical protein